MNAYRTTRWTHKLVFAAAAAAIGLGLLELVAGAMAYPDPEAMAMREQVIAAQSERAQQIRMLQQGELKLASIPRSAGI